jgi:hypothetical protein
MSKSQLVWAVLFAGLSVAAGLLSRTDMPLLLRYTLPAVCVLLGGAYFRALFRDFQSSTDELQRRLHLEAAVGACAGLYVAMMVYPAFHNTGLVPRLDPFAVLLLLVLLYGAGYAAARRRYS